MTAEALDPSPGRQEAPPGGIAQLRRENAYLIQRINEVGRIERDLSEARHQLDQLYRRFQRMDEFMRRGMQAETRNELASIACEAIVDVLECEAGLVWCFRCPQGPDSVYLSPGYEMDLASRQFLMDWIRRRSECESPAALPPPPALRYRDWLVQELRDDKGALDGLLIAANTLGESEFHEPLDESSSQILATLAGQLAALVSNRHSRDTIRAQLQQIRESEQLLNLALESSNVGLWDWEIPSGRVIFSEQYKGQLGEASDEIPASFSEWERRLHPEDRAHALETLRRFVRSKRRTYQNTFRLRHNNGRWIWISSTGFSILDAKGVTVRVIGTHTDITGFKKLEDKLRRAKEASDRASDAKSTFLAKVSHELRTPLNGMLGSLQLLKTTVLDEEQRGLLDLGYSSGRWMLSIIGDGLDLARIEAGKLELVATAFDPARLVSELLVFQKASIAAKGLELVERIDPSVPGRLRGDSAAIRQIVANLVGNAIKFTDQGSILVSLQARPGKGPEHVQLILTVEDTGIGIPKGASREIFKPFQQAATADNRQSGGIGLGLAVCRELVKLMGGTIRHRSRAHHGTRFTVTLPLEVLPSTPEMKLAAESAAEPCAGRVLVVDDDATSRHMAALMLEKLGARVDTAANGEEGLRMLLEHDFDLAFVDCWMPRMDGLEMTRRIRAEPGTRGCIPIIALTANSQQSDLDACHDAGMNDCVIKPFLAETLRKHLLDHHPAAAPTLISVSP
jgi:PAS domain S-box-containing protein